MIPTNYTHSLLYSGFCHMNLWPFCSHFWPSPVPAFASKILNLHQVPNHRHGRFQTSTQDVAHHLEDGRKLNEACEFLGECLWEATPFCKVLRCSKLKGKLLSKKNRCHCEVILIFCSCLCTFRTVAHEFSPPPQLRSLQSQSKVSSESDKISIYLRSLIPSKMGPI